MGCAAKCLTTLYPVGPHWVPDQHPTCGGRFGAGKAGPIFLRASKPWGPSPRAVPFRRAACSRCKKPAQAFSMAPSGTTPSVRYVHQLAAHGYQHDPPHASLGRAHPHLEPTRERAAGLMAQAEPSHLDRRSPCPTVARLGNALPPSDLAARPGAGPDQGSRASARIGRPCYPRLAPSPSGLPRARRSSRSPGAADRIPAARRFAGRVRAAGRQQRATRPAAPISPRVRVRSRAGPGSSEAP